MRQQYAVLMDIASIQKYVFSGNKLSENLGASDIVCRTYSEEYIQDFLDEVHGESFSPARDEKGNFKGTLGGGEALLIFESETSEIAEKKAINFVKEYTKFLLINAPGLKLSTAISKFDENDYKKYSDQIHDKLVDNKSRHRTQTIIPSHGITAECSKSGFSMECFDRKTNSWISSVSKAMIDHAAAVKNKFAQIIKNAVKKLNPEEEILLGKITQGQELEVSDQTDKIAQNDPCHIAVVHIDGNSMGDVFMKISTLNDINIISKVVKETISETFEEMVRVLIEKIAYRKIKIKNNILPLRLIIKGGDDLTFVCDGKIAIFLSKIFLEFYEKISALKINQIRNIINDKSIIEKLKLDKLTACAGISITKPKYPFYRSYQFSEELCKSAKKRMREIGNKAGSWIDFQAVYGSISENSIGELREKHFTASSGNLLLRPYEIGSSDEHPEISLKKAIENSLKLKKKPKKDPEGNDVNFPDTKIQKFKAVLSGTNSDIESFKKEIAFRNFEIPEVNDNSALSHSFFQIQLNNINHGKKTTPYFDMIELLEFYPESLMEESK
jgi:hypothetical protein